LDQPSGRANPSDRDSDARDRLAFRRRESEVLVRVQRGLENKAIAFDLGMAEQSRRGSK
jgi:FixJ family two-component response regulator